jgi:hypothetical protein
MRFAVAYDTTLLKKPREIATFQVTRAADLAI